MTKPVCVPCQRFFRPEQNGFPLIEGMPVGPDRVPPGTAAPHLWKPYKLWMADKWRCHGCGTEVVVGFGQQPLAIQHEPDFAANVAYHKATFQVNDC